MPRKICIDCGGQYGRYRWTEIRDDLPCEECAQLKRQNLEREAADARQREQDDAQHARQLDIRQAELDADVQKTRQEEETKRSGKEAEERSKQAEIQAKNEQQKMEVREIEAKTKLRLEEEKTKQSQLASQDKRDRMKEETRKLELECAMNDTKAATEVKLAQEHTKQVRINQLENVVKIVTRLAAVGNSKETINAQLQTMLGGEFPPEKVNLPPVQPKVSKRKIECPVRVRVQTAPVAPMYFD